MTKILPFQNELQGVLPVVVGNAEYNNFKALLFRVAELIEFSGIEKKAITPLSEQMQISIQERVRLAIRVTIIMISIFSSSLDRTPLLT